MGVWDADSRDIDAPIALASTGVFRSIALLLLLSLLPGAQEVFEQVGHVASTGSLAHSADDEAAHHEHEHEHDGEEGASWQAADHGHAHHGAAPESHCSAVAHTCHCCPTTSLTITIVLEVVAPVLMSTELLRGIARLDAGVAPRLMRPPIA